MPNLLQWAMILELGQDTADETSLLKVIYQLVIENKSGV
jgi:hypothetical protein